MNNSLAPIDSAPRTVPTVEECRAAIEAAKAHRREALKAVVDRNPYGKLARKASALLLDESIFDDFLEEHGGDDGLMRWIAAQVASGVTLKVLAEHYCVDYGLIWAWLSVDEERLGIYYRAQRGVADAYVSEVVDIADDATPEDLSVKKWQGQARMAVAAKLDRERFGERDVGVTVEMRDRRKPDELMAEMRALLAANPGLRERVGEVIDVEILNQATDGNALPEVPAI